MPFEYPGEGRDVPEHISRQFSRVHAMYGTRDLDRISKTPGVSGIAPWPSAGKTKQGPNYDQGVVRDALLRPPQLQSVDPRNLHSSQPGITREGVDYYLNDQTYSSTGRTFADQGNVGNRHPTIYAKDDGRNIILAGHHRASAALLSGKQFQARVIPGP